MDVSKDIIGCISKVQVKINGLRQERFSCSQATFIGICRTVGCNQTDEELKMCIRDRYDTASLWNCFLNVL